MIQKMPLRKTAKVCKAADRRGDGRRPLRSTKAERPASIQHSALSIQHYPRNARAVASARHPFSIQHSAFSIRNRRPHAIILRPFGSLPKSSLGSPLRGGRRLRRARIEQA